MKKSLVLIFALWVIIVSACLPLAARERRGAMVVVTMTDGSQARGELLTVKKNALIVHNPDTGQGWSIDLRQVAHVMVIRESKFLLGTIIGVGIGLGITRCTMKSDDKAGLFYGLGSALLVPAAGLIGGFVGAAAGKDKKIPMAGVSVLIAQQNLERLRRYAREQDVPQ